MSYDFQGNSRSGVQEQGWGVGAESPEKRQIPIGWESCHALFL